MQNNTAQNPGQDSDRLVKVPRQRTAHPTGLDEQMLVESPSARARYADRVDVLDKVGGLVLLPDNTHATTDQVAAFYEVPLKTIESLVKANAAELEANGRRVLRGEDLRDFATSYGKVTNLVINPKARSLALFSRKAILNVGQLLTGSKVAKRVRQYLLTVEETATPEHRESAYRLIRLQERQDYKNVLDSLKMGGAESGDYATAQNMLYLSLFGLTAVQIRRTRAQIDGERRRDGKFSAASAKVAKNYLSDGEIKLLDNAVLIITAQLALAYPGGAPLDGVLDVMDSAVTMVKHRQLQAAA